MAPPQSPFRQIKAKPVHFHPLESGESGSDSEIEMSEFSSLGRKRVSATNPLSNHGLGEKHDRNLSETDTDKSGDENARRVSESGSGTGKFAQLKGKFFQRVSNLRPPKASLKFRPSSRGTQNGGDSDSSVQSQSSSKFTSARRGQTNNSSDSLRRLRNRSPPRNEPSEEELKRQRAMEKSKTTFLILKAV